MDHTHPALDPAHRPRELDRIAAKRIGCRGQARGLLGVGHHLFDLVELPRKPGGQTVRQQAERGVALGAVPASDPRPARALARAGAVAGQRTPPSRVIGAALKPCIAPRLGPNVCLAGKPRVVAKLHRPWPGGVCPPRGPTPPVLRGAETTPATLATPAVTMWTRPSDRAPSYGPCGQGLDKCCALAHPLPTLAALAPTASTLQQQRFMKKTTAPAPAGSRIAPPSQAIRLRSNQVKSRGRPTRESAKQQPRALLGRRGLGCDLGSARLSLPVRRWGAEWGKGVVTGGKSGLQANGDKAIANKIARVALVTAW